MNFDDGFTFVEVLVALLIASLLVTVACAALITSLRAEERAMSLREERYELRTAATHEWAGTGD